MIGWLPFAMALLMIGVGVGGIRWIWAQQYDKQTSIDLMEIPGFLTADECDRWVEWIRTHPEHFVESEVDRGWFGSRRDRVYLKHRRSRQCWLSRVTHLLALGVSLKARLVLMRYLGGGTRYTEERLQVVHYAPGGYFRPHYDEYGSWWGNRRYVTLLVYLNDDYQGGETCFPRLNRCIRPEKGKAILFKNTNRATGRILWHSFHEGRPVVSRGDGDASRKYILNLWIHLDTSCVTN